MMTAEVPFQIDRITEAIQRFHWDEFGLGAVAQAPTQDWTRALGLAIYDQLFHGLIYATEFQVPRDPGQQPILVTRLSHSLDGHRLWQVLDGTDRRTSAVLSEFDDRNKALIFALEQSYHD